MSHVRVERVLLARMRRQGLSDDAIALIVYAWMHGSPTAERLVERAAGSRARVEDGVAVATVEIAPGLGWAGGVLHDPTGSLPLTVLHGAMGMPISAVMEHPDVDPGGIISPPPVFPAEGSLQVPIESVALRVPISPVAWLRHALAIRRKRLADVPIARWVFWTMFVCTLVAGNSFALHARKIIATRDLWTIDLALLLLSLPSFLMLLFMTVDAFTGRVISERLMKGRTTHQMLADDKHFKWLLDEHMRRGFDEHGKRM